MWVAECQVELERVGGLPEDTIVNRLFFVHRTAATSASLTFGDVENQVAGLFNRIESFYAALSTYWSAGLSGNGRIKLYARGDEKPRAPRAEHAFTFTRSSSRLPSEVAAVLSFEGERQSGMQQARRRGRIFLGPFGTGAAFSGTGDKDARVHPSLMTAALNAAEAHLFEGSTTEAFRHCVFSPTQYAVTNGDEEASVTEIRKYWMDSAFDTQRSRGKAPSGRDVREVESSH